jgi:hypothetical protein
MPFVNFCDTSVDWRDKNSATAAMTKSGKRIILYYKLRPRIAHLSLTCMCLIENEISRYTARYLGPIIMSYREVTTFTLYKAA